MEELKKKAEAIENEAEVGKNTSERVGGLFKELIEVVKGKVDSLGFKSAVEKVFHDKSGWLMQALEGKVNTDNDKVLSEYNFSGHFKNKLRDLPDRCVLKELLDAKMDKNAIYGMGEIIYKYPVLTFDDLSTTYPKPEKGWDVLVMDENIRYRWNGKEWIPMSTGLRNDEFERRFTLRLESRELDLYIDESMTIYKVGGKNISGLKLNDQTVTIDSVTQVDIPAKSMLKIEVDRQFTDPISHLYIYAKVITS